MVDFLEQVQKIVRDLSEIVSQTIEQKLDELSKFDEKAGSKVTSTFDEVQKKMREISNANSSFKAHIQEKEPEIQEIQSNMKSSLIECYKKKYSPVEKLQAERSTIHKEAVDLKTGAQKIIMDCTMSENRQKCFQQGLSDLEKKARKLLKKFQALLKKETDTRIECTKLMLECDKKAASTAEKKIRKIIDEIMKSAK